MNSKRMEIIDKLVNEFLKHRGRKQEKAFLQAVEPVVRSKARKTCIGSTKWDEGELYSILIEDMWRLLKGYVPDGNNRFHFLMLRQLNNKTINYINNTTNRKYKVCFICNTAHEKGAAVCKTCGTQLNHPRSWTHISHEEFIIPAGRADDNVLDNLSNKELVESLLERVKFEDPKTYLILTMYLEGYSKSEIGRELGGMPQNALNHRIRKCAKIIENME